MALVIAAGQCIKACWIGFIIYWAISALRQRAVAEHAPWVEQLAHKVPVGLGAWLMFVPSRYNPLAAHLPLVQPACGYFGALLCVLGLVGAIWARWTLAGNWSSNVAFKQGHELIERGPYRFVRHPIYTSLLLMGLGTALYFERVGAFAGLLLWFVGFWIKLTQEEQLLTRHFPAEYPAYMSRVKALIPFIV
jgi:protein-S-isoprenylcysteine O-methyltransferase Ste14